MVDIKFDEFGVTAFKKNIEEILKMVIEYQNMRAEHNKIEKAMEAKKKLDEINLGSVRNVANINTGNQGH